MPDEAYDNTMLAYYKLCQRKYYYRMEKHLTLKGLDNFDHDFKAQWGVAWHLAMDELFLGRDVKAINKAFIEHWMPFEGSDVKELRTLANGLTLLERYQNLYPAESEPFDVVHVEVGFSINLMDFIYCGRIDKILDMKMPGYEGLLVMDHKSSSSRGFVIVNPNDALTGYIFGAGEIIGKRFVGAYLDRVHLYKTRQPDTKVFIRELTIRTDEQISEWQREVGITVEQIRGCRGRVESFGELNWPKTTSACSAFGKECEYICLCRSPRANREGLEHELYQSDPWYPNADNLYETEVEV